MPAADEVMDREQETKPSPWVAIVVIVFCLGGALVLSLSPPEMQARILAGISVLVTALAAVKFGAVSLICFKEGRRLLALLWGLGAVGFLLLLLAALSNLLDAWGLW